MDKLKMHSSDLSQDNIAKIRELFPGCVTEARDEATGALRLAVDFDQLRQELSDHIVEGPQERYRLDWPGKRGALALANAAIANTFRPYREESVRFDDSQNVFIEGDNLDAMKLLQESYLGKIKAIYIDPPYNTGNDFVYNDKFAENPADFLARSNQKDEAGNLLVANTAANGRFHSDWLSMMYPRLKLARNLLTEDGVIFISIDDNEEHNIRKLCDEIFGAENLIGPLIQNKLNSKNDAVNVQRNHEYIICYRKSTRYVSSTKIEPSLEKRQVEETEVFLEGDDYYILNDPITTRGDGGTLNKRKNLGYTVYYNPTTSDFVGVNDYNVELAQTSNDENEVYTDNQELIAAGYIKIRPPKVRGKLGAWTWELDKFNSNKRDIVIKETRNGHQVRKRTFLSNPVVEERGGQFFVTHTKSSNSRSILEFSTNEGSTQLSDLLGHEGVFDNPKNVNLIKYLIGLLPQKDFIVLDFFAGSGVTADAVMQLNAEDGGKRRFVMVQLPEETEDGSEAREVGFTTIAEISKERIRRAGQKILEGECHPNWNKDVGFRVLKIDTSNMQDVYYTPDQTDQRSLLGAVDNIKSDRSAEDLLFQVLVDWGVDLTLPISSETIHGKKIYFVDDNALAACFETGVKEDLVKELATREPLRVVFRDNGFVSDAVKINVEQIFKQLSPMTDVKAI
ncbi:site-specific DNA-methyltransferase [Ruegeria pomeroyi]|nr:site-specific DNA-methyltransferase [Ruegeria pomeroyi]